MAWVELVPIGLILLLVAWIFLRPYPGHKKSERHSGEDSQEKTFKHHNRDKDKS